MFINLNKNGVTVNPWRDPSAEVCELPELLESLENFDTSPLTCSTEGVADALEDGEFLSTVNVTQETVEYLHSLVRA